MTIKPKNIVEACEARHRHTCPCCGTGMVKAAPKPGRPVASNTRTAGHDEPVWRGGRLWVYICSGCNTEQGDLTFRSWALMLRRADDGRAARVEALADLFDQWRHVPTDATIRGMIQIGKHGRTSWV